jgi:pimeloyl-ACP methyl ester carboxylesterase
VVKLVSIEGLGSPPAKQRERNEMSVQPRLRGWIDEVRDLARRMPRRYATLEEALQRMREANPHLRSDQARHLTIHGVNQNEDGSYTWKFDNYFRVMSPHGITVSETHELWSKITCPILHMRGLDSWLTDPRADERAACFGNARYVEFEDAGHWVHHDQLDGVLSAVRGFLAE